MAPYDDEKILIASSADEHMSEALLVLPNVEEGTVLVVENNDGSCTLPTCDCSHEVGIEMKKALNLNLDYTFLRPAYEEDFEVEYGDTTTDIS